VVEDEAMLREIACDVLRQHGYAVLEAPHGGEALMLCERHQGPIDLMLTDVVMPHMSGRELYDRVAPLRPGMRVLYMSGYTDHAIVERGVLQPGTALLQKPFTPDSLALKVREVLEESALAEAGAPRV
jgi:CheY-like chemotaxis protein